MGGSTLLHATPLLAVLAALLLLPTGGALLASSQNDAGSGRDAGPDAATGIPIASGLYEGNLTGLVQGDTNDVYLVEAHAGDRIRVNMTVFPTGACAFLYAPSGAQVSYDCTVDFLSGQPLDVIAGETGTWSLDVNGRYPATYQFALGVNEAPAQAALSLEDLTRV